MAEDIYLKNGETILGSNGPFLRSYYMASDEGPGIVERYCPKCVNGKMTYYQDLSSVKTHLPSEQGWFYEASEPFNYGTYEIKYIIMWNAPYGHGEYLTFFDDSSIRLNRYPGTLVNGIDGLGGIRYGGISGSLGYDLLSPTPIYASNPSDPETDIAPRHKVLKYVETIEVTPSLRKTEQDGSDSKASVNTINSESLELGSIAPGEISKTKIIHLKVPASLGIDNIKLGLIDSGGIEFEENVFGIETLSYLDYNIVPSNFFQGVNSNKKSNSPYNINIPNNGVQKSQYVYLNVNLPSNHALGGGVVRYKWFFDYQSGVSATESTGETNVGTNEVNKLGDNLTDLSEFPSKIIVSGSNHGDVNGPDINGTYKVGKIHAPLGDIAWIKYYPENAASNYPSPEDYRTGYVPILQIVYTTGQNWTARLFVQTTAPKPWTADLPSWSYSVTHELFYFSDLNFNSRPYPLPPELSPEEVWENIDGKIFKYHPSNLHSSAIRDFFSSDPYANDTFTTTVVW